jgi:hypothetical protein
LTNSPADGKPVQGRQHDVQQYQIEGFFETRIKTLSAVCQTLNFLPIVNQHIDQPAQKCRIILNDQNACFRCFHFSNIISHRPDCKVKVM